MRKVLLPWWLLLMLFLAWWLLPTQLGGRTSYVIVNGNSMYPTLHKGDLVLVRRTERYSQGQIAAYRYPDIGLVIHRIVGTEGDRFIFKGDHNSWIDGYRPAAEEVLGAYWLKIPLIGGLLSTMSSPLDIALLTMAIGAMILGPTTLSRNRGTTSRYQAVPALGSALLVTAALSLLLGILAYTRPTQVEAMQEVPYSQTGTFQYTARANPAVYDGGVITTGQAVFTKLVSSLQMQLSYRFSSTEPHSVQGTYRVLAQISDASGWKRSLELVPSRAFMGGSFQTSFQLDLGRVQDIIDEAQRLTGVQRDQYNLTIIGQISTKGTLDGQTLSTRFTPSMAFQLDTLQLQLVQPTEGNATGKNQQSTLRVPGITSNTLHLGPLALPVTAARWLSTLLLLASALGLIALQGWSRRLEQLGEPAIIASRWNHLMVEVLEPPRSDTAVILRDLTSLEHLLAGTQGARLLHFQQGSVHHYYLDDGGHTYVYAAEERCPAS